MKRLHVQSGYSLLELVVYIALFIVISIVIINSLITVMKTYSTANGYRRLQSNGELVMERVVREIRQASAVGSSTVYTSNPGILVVQGVDDIGAARTVTFSVVNNAVQINDNGATGALSSNEVTTTSLIFKHITTTVGEGIKV